MASSDRYVFYPYVLSPLHVFEYWMLLYWQLLDAENAILCSNVNLYVDIIIIYVNLYVYVNISIVNI